MFSRLAQIFFSLFTSRFEELLTAALFAVAQQLLQKGKKTLLVILSCFVLSILLTAGIIIFTLEAAAQYDARGTIFFTALLTSSLVMVAFSLITLTIIFWPRQPPVLTLPAQNLNTHAHPFEEILKAAIAEGIQYFKNKTEQGSKPRSSEYSRA